VTYDGDEEKYLTELIDKTRALPSMDIVGVITGAGWLPPNLTNKPHMELFTLSDEGGTATGMCEICDEKWPCPHIVRDRIEALLPRITELTATERDAGRDDTALQLVQEQIRAALEEK
jgi:hypothetical protein